MDLSSRFNMFPAHRYNSCKQQLLSESLLDKDNYNFGSSKMYSTKQSLSVDSIVDQPKKEGMWHSMLRSCSNFIPQLNRSSFVKNFTNMNTPLSVTFVSPDFYKSLHGKDHQMINPSEGIFSSTTKWNEESHGSVGLSLQQDIFYDTEIQSEFCAKKNSSDPSDCDRRWMEYKNMYVDNIDTMKEDVKNEKIVNIGEDSEHNPAILNSSSCDCAPDNKGLDRSTNFANTLDTNDQSSMLEEKVAVENQVASQEQDQSELQEFNSQIPLVSTMTNYAYNVYNKFTDLLQLNSAPPENETSSLFTKRACSPKPKPKKVHNISSGRGRGRGKSQLRRSGVSQTRHRKERSRYDCSVDIKADIDHWQDFEYCNAEDDRFEDFDECDCSSSKIDVPDHMTSFDLADIKPKRTKSKKDRKRRGWTQVSVAFSIQSVDDNGKERLSFRPRLLSESSVDSEDSYCIVFEGDTCIDDSDTDSEIDSYLDTESETDNESEVEKRLTCSDIESRSSKVRFDLLPVVHTMVQWDYAYRAARRGPWEEMARDRERFKSRIDCTGRLLDPILASQHRMRVWRERFTSDSS